jgi:hypothetical protein
MGMGFLLGKENVLKLHAQLYECDKVIELYDLNGWIL